MAVTELTSKPTRTDRFTFLCTPEERDQVDELARRLEREASDAVRYVIRAALAELRSEQDK